MHGSFEALLFSFGLSFRECENQIDLTSTKGTVISWFNWFLKRCGMYICCSSYYNWFLVWCSTKIWYWRFKSFVLFNVVWFGCVLWSCTSTCLIYKLWKKFWKNIFLFSCYNCYTHNRCKCYTKKNQRNFHFSTRWFYYFPFKWCLFQETISIDRSLNWFDAFYIQKYMANQVIRWLI